MNRQIITDDDLYLAKPLIPGLKQEDQGDDLYISDKPDSYLSRLLKYIPTEIIGLYITIENIALTNPSEINYLWISFFSCLILTPAYLYRINKVKKIDQLIISTVSFAVWIFAIGGPFEYLGYYDQTLAAMLLPIYTLLVSIIKPSYKL